MKSWKHFFLYLAIVLLCISGSSCAPAVSGNSLPVVDESQCLTIFTCYPEEIYAPLVEEFESRTGLWVQVMTGDSEELLNALEEENDGQIDVLLGGDIGLLNAHKSLFTPYTSEQCLTMEALDIYNGDGLWSCFSVRPLVFVYNTKLVSKGDTHFSWKHLTDPKWKGRIAFADPSDSMPCFTALSVAVQLYGEEYAEKFACNLDGKCLERFCDVVRFVANGTYLIGVTLEDIAQDAIADGMDIAYLYPEDGVGAAVDGIAIVSNAPHLENARNFVDFALSRDTQYFLCETQNWRPVWSDVDTTDRQKLENLDLYYCGQGWSMQEQEDLLMRWQYAYASAEGNAS